MIRRYMNYTQKMEAVRKLIVHPLTLAEKILYTHSWGEKLKKFTKEEFLMSIFLQIGWHARCNCSNGSFAIYASW